MRSRRRHLGIFITLVAFAALPAALWAQGGPPLLTDDPGTPGNGNSELNIAFTLERFRHESLYEAPLLDFNYGVGERIQLKIELPWLLKHENPGPDASGLGNVLLGFKYRFLDHDKSEVDVSFYPQAEFRTTAHSRRTGLVGEGLSLLLPVQAAREFGPIGINVELGYLLAEEEEDAWVWGVALSHDLVEGLEILGEIHGVTGTRFDRGELVWNIGARIKLNDLNTVLLSVGRGIRGESREEPSLLIYLGLQFNF
jgi:hypothetical protein